MPMEPDPIFPSLHSSGSRAQGLDLNIGYLRSDLKWVRKTKKGYKNDKLSQQLPEAQFHGRPSERRRI